MWLNYGVKFKITLLCIQAVNQPQLALTRWQGPMLSVLIIFIMGIKFGKS